MPSATLCHQSVSHTRNPIWGNSKWCSGAVGKWGSWLGLAPCPPQIKTCIKTEANEVLGLASDTTAEKTTYKGARLSLSITQNKESTKVKKNWAAQVVCRSYRNLPQPHCANPVAQLPRFAGLTEAAAARGAGLLKDKTHKQTAAAQSQGVAIWVPSRASQFCCCLRLADGGVVLPLPILLTVWLCWLFSYSCGALRESCAIIQQG